MKNINRLLIPLLTICILGLGFWCFRLHTQKIIPIKVNQENKAELSINDGSTSKSFDISLYVGRSALEATSSVLSGKITTNGTDANAFVTSLNDRSANSKKHEFWELDANGIQTQVGAGSYIIKNNDKIEWKISTY